MPRLSPRKDLTLKALELFEICARKSSVQATAVETGLSVSTVSHHLRCLEDHLGVALFDHSRRPMTLTPKGQVFLKDIEGALSSIRKATAEASTGNVTETSYLRFGSIADLDSDITPDLAVYFSRKMAQCNFLFRSGSSREILDMLRDRHLDMAIAASPPEGVKNLNDAPLLRDPFVVVLAAAETSAAADVVAGKTDLPFLQFSGDLIIARQIEVQLRRLGVVLPNRFECGNNQTLMAMVAAGAGWTITTPLLFSRARRFHSKLRMYPFPGKSFSRTLSLVTTPDCAESVQGLVNRKVRKLLTRHALTPLHQTTPWLEDSFCLISGTD